MAYSVISAPLKKGNVR